MSGTDDKRAKAFSEVKAMGYNIVNVDINYATKSWTILDGKRFMPSFLPCKGIGEAAVDEIIENRPYKSLEEMLWYPTGQWRHSKFNKRTLEGLIAIKAFDSLECIGPDKTFNNYKQMHEVLINRNNEIKKWTKKNPTAGMEAFKSAMIETAEIEDWTRRELVDNAIKFLGSFNPATLVPDYILRKFEERGIKPIDEIESSDVYWFVVTDVKQKKTKNGKPYLLLTTSGLAGQSKRIFCWGWDGRTDIPIYSVCISEITVDDFGCKTFVSKVKILES
jgi:DNA polymerase III alpha subunit